MYKKTSWILRILAVALAFQMAMPVVTQALSITITIVIGVRSEGCKGLPPGKGFGLCKISIDVGMDRKAASPNTVSGSAELSGDKMVVTFNGPLPENRDVLPADEDIVLDAATSKAMGFKQVTILKGQYPINRRGGKFGSVTFNVKGEK